ncbi:DUF992 domain-containing protein [uncultured Methylobacterium sp.]|uniref:DUF992 domain-containing protein n=1 Tax=uncultured Methylobacterium sp. TaxID=157278 RepID=UPI002617919C|nr:DUF992 domain-containing protein [uncultured Methylobacterium sp.]
MRPLVVALAASLVATAAAYALARPGPQPDWRTAGTLTCTTNPNLRLVLGHTGGATCTFVAARGDLRQTYAALFSQARGTGDPTAATVSWHVLTADGTAGAGRLDGLFDGGARGSATGVPAFEARSGTVRLEPGTPAGPVPDFAAHNAVLALAPAPASP